ncbi:hypothetical protein T484DRAFT_1740381 [Baffinella frigidus]|nr:hypothetical protein T484DRAFT_1740381 [Cryptophyta sp. CCMP2293]
MDGVDLKNAEQLWRKGRGRVQEKVCNRRSRLHSADLLPSRDERQLQPVVVTARPYLPPLSSQRFWYFLAQIRIPSTPTQLWLRAGPGREVSREFEGEEPVEQRRAAQ